MEKVKVTEQHLRELKIWNDNNNKFSSFILGVGRRTGTYENLYKLTPEQFALLLCDWYEVEPEFKEGDWIHNNVTGRVAKMDDRGYDEEVAWVDDDKVNFFTEFRHATPEEIAEEKERRFFNEHGRKPWELKVGDVLVKKMDNFPLVVTEVNAEEITLNLLTCTRSEVKKRCKVLCFVDDRLDVSAE